MNEFSPEEALKVMKVQEVITRAMSGQISWLQAGADENSGEGAAAVPQEHAGWNVRHFHEKLGEEHGIKFSYQWVKN